MGKTDYVGIDYGLGQANMGEKARYGVIHSREIGQAWYEESEDNYLYFCPKCNYEIGYEFMDICPECGYKIQDYDFDMLDPISFSYDQDGYACEQGYDDPDIFILKSPFYTWCQFCSPCAPGAGYVMNWTEPGVGIKSYCFGPDWFEDNKAPYPVYRVEDDELVEV